MAGGDAGPGPARGTGNQTGTQQAVEAVTAELGGRTSELVELLDSAYRRLPPGGRLEVRVRPGSELSGPLDEVRDRIGGLLFAGGFEATRLERLGGATVVSARRSRKAPPGERAAVLSVVMPVYNERATAKKAIELVLSKEIAGVEIELVIVESNSADGTREDVLELAGHPRVRLVLEERPEGKGHAVRAGLAAATGDFVLIQDADLEYDVDDYEALIDPLRTVRAGFVLGYRRRTDGARFGVRHFERQAIVSQAMNVGNVLFLSLFNLVYRSRLRDPFTMYKVFRRDCLHGMRLECDRFDFDWELCAKLLRAGYRPIEVPVAYRSRSFSEGKKVSVLFDPLSWVVACFKYRFARIWD